MVTKVPDIPPDITPEGLFCVLAALAFVLLAAPAEQEQKQKRRKDGRNKW